MDWTLQIEKSLIYIYKRKKKGRMQYFIYIHKYLSGSITVSTSIMFIKKNNKSDTLLDNFITVGY